MSMINIVVTIICAELHSIFMVNQVEGTGELAESETISIPFTANPHVGVLGVEVLVPAPADDVNAKFE